MNIFSQGNRIEPFLIKSNRYIKLDRREYRLMARCLVRAAALEAAMKAYYGHLNTIMTHSDVRKTCAAFAAQSSAEYQILVKFLSALVQKTGGIPEKTQRYFTGPDGCSLMGILDRMLELCREKALIVATLMHMAGVEDRPVFREMVIKNRNEIQFLKREKHSRMPLSYGMTWAGSYFSLIAVS